MTITERNNKLKHFITCLKCEVSGKPCDVNCLTQYDAGNIGEIIENLEAISKALEQESKWIPVEHELPEKGRQVLCCNEHGSVFTSAITYIEKYKDGNRYVCFGQHHGVVAWMPLPKLYEPQESEDKK